MFHELRRAEGPEDLSAHLGRIREGFDVRQVAAAEARDFWSCSDGALQHRSGGFFSVNGVRAEPIETVLLYQPQAAVTGIATFLSEGRRWFLLQARAEPGCLGGAQFGPTVQSTPANYLRMHGGLATPQIGAFTRHVPELGWIIQDTAQLDLGERYAFKTKRSILVDLREATETEPSMIWVDASTLREAVRRNAFLNIDLRSILAVAPWHASDSGHDLEPQAGCVRRGLTAPLREDVLGQVFAALRRHDPGACRFIPLSDLSNWEETEWGWSERERDRGYEIAFYETTARHREVTRWIQPLVNSLDAGEVILACRERNGVLETLVRVASETGLATGAAVLPTFLRYPGEMKPTPDWLVSPPGWTWLETTESDEGGRFYIDSSRYALVRLDDVSIPEGFPGVWVTVAELKALLATSNTCSIQLRGVASLLLGARET